MKSTYAPKLFGQAAASMGHHPFPQPSGNMSQPYTNPLGVQQGACTYCGFLRKGSAAATIRRPVPQTTVVAVPDA